MADGAERRKAELEEINIFAADSLMEIFGFYRVDRDEGNTRCDEMSRVVEEIQNVQEGK